MSERSQQVSERQRKIHIKLSRTVSMSLLGSGCVHEISESNKNECVVSVRVCVSSSLSGDLFWAAALTQQVRDLGEHLFFEISYNNVTYLYQN